MLININGKMKMTMKLTKTNKQKQKLLFKLGSGVRHFNVTLIPGGGGVGCVRGWGGGGVRLTELSPKHNSIEEG